MITVICSKHVEDTLSEINYEEKVCILLVFLTTVHHDALFAECAIYYLLKIRPERHSNCQHTFNKNLWSLKPPG